VTGSNDGSVCSPAHLRRARRFLAHLTLVTLLVLSVGVNALPGAAFAARWDPPSTPMLATPPPPPVPGEIVVQPGQGATIDALNAKYVTTTLFQFTDSTSALVSTPDLGGTLASMATDRSIAWFEANNKARQPAAKDDGGADPYCGAAEVPTSAAVAKDDGGADPHCTHVIQDGAADYEDQWADTRINLGWAHKRTQGQGVTIAVLDTAVESHPAFKDRVLPSIDLVPLDPQTNVQTTGIKRGHGTFVAGVALHVAPLAKILPVRVLNDDGRGSTSLIAEGIRRATKQGARGVNLSLGTPTPARALQEAVTYAQDRGVILVAAYGNEGQRDPGVYPADFPSVMSVVATDELDMKAAFTNWGRKADVAAPGVSIVGPWRDGQYGVGSGTSYATPIVSGQVALLLSLGAARRQDDAQTRVSTSVDNIDAINGITMGVGRINLPNSILGVATRSRIIR
jgi:subtilisin family serine protease